MLIVMHLKIFFKYEETDTQKVFIFVEFHLFSYRCILFMNFYSAFQNNVEIHINHIQSGLSQMGNLHAFSSSTYKVWPGERSRPVWLTLNDLQGHDNWKHAPSCYGLEAGLV